MVYNKAANLSLEQCLTNACHDDLMHELMQDVSQTLVAHP